MSFSVDPTTLHRSVLNANSSLFAASPKGNSAWTPETRARTMASGNESRFGRLLLPLVAPVALLTVSVMMGYLYIFVMDLQRSILETNLNLKEIDGRYKAKIARLEAAVFLLSALSRRVNQKQAKSNSGGQVSARPVAQSSREIIKRLKTKPSGSVDKQTDQRIRKGEDLTGDIRVWLI